jgi:hypothetical protein
VPSLASIAGSCQRIHQDTLGRFPTKILTKGSGQSASSWGPASVYEGNLASQIIPRGE